jgi:hypothetical protein
VRLPLRTFGEVAAHEIPLAVVDQVAANAAGLLGAEPLNIKVTPFTARRGRTV